MRTVYTQRNGHESEDRNVPLRQLVLAIASVGGSSSSSSSNSFNSNNNNYYYSKMIC